MKVLVNISFNGYELRISFIDKDDYEYFENRPRNIKTKKKFDIVCDIKEVKDILKEYKIENFVDF